MAAEWETAWAIVSKEYKETKHKWIVVLYPVLLCVLFIVSMVMIARLIVKTGDLGTFRLVSEMAVTNYFIAYYILSLLYMIPYVLQKEKMAGTIEWLLASPVTPKAIWIGKATFLALWSFACTLMYLIALAVVLHHYRSAIGMGSAFTAMLPVFILLSIAVCAALTLLVSGLAMLFNPRLVSLLTMLIAMGLMMSAPLLARYAATSFIRFGLLALASVTCAIGCAMLARFLTRERVLLG